MLEARARPASGRGVGDLNRSSQEHRPEHRPGPLRSASHGSYAPSRPHGHGCGAHVPLV